VAVFLSFVSGNSTKALIGVVTDTNKAGANAIGKDATKANELSPDECCHLPTCA